LNGGNHGSGREPARRDGHRAPRSAPACSGRCTKAQTSAWYFAATAGSRLIGHVDAAVGPGPARPGAVPTARRASASAWSCSFRTHASLARPCWAHCSSTASTALPACPRRHPSPRRRCFRGTGWAGLRDPPAVRASSWMSYALAALAWRRPTSWTTGREQALRREMVRPPNYVNAQSLTSTATTRALVGPPLSRPAHRDHRIASRSSSRGSPFLRPCLRRAACDWPGGATPPNAPAVRRKGSAAKGLRYCPADAPTSGPTRFTGRGRGNLRS